MAKNVEIPKGYKIDKIYVPKSDSYDANDIICEVEDKENIDIDFVGGDDWSKNNENTPISGYIIDPYSRINANSSSVNNKDSYNIFISYDLAKSAIAEARLSQIMKNSPKYNKYLISDNDWNTNTDNKYIIVRYKDSIIGDVTKNNYSFLAFKNNTVRDEFMQDNIEEIKAYFMLENEFTIG